MTTIVMVVCQLARECNCAGKNVGRCRRCRMAIVLPELMEQHERYLCTRCKQYTENKVPLIPRQVNRSA